MAASQKSEVMKDLSGIVADIASANSPDGRLNILVRSSGMVTVEFGERTWIVLIRNQASMVARCAPE